MNKTFLREWLEWLALACVAASVLVLFVGRIIIITGDSMLPNLKDGDVVVTEKLSAIWRQPKRGEVYGFTCDAEEGILIKRMVALPGDLITIDRGVLYLNGAVQQEDYINGAMGPWTNLEPTLVPDNHYFMMGDNRDRSLDSRDPEIGPVPQEWLQGRVVWCLWPLSKFGPVAAAVHQGEREPVKNPNP
jgi:signal peptidase I